MKHIRHKKTSVLIELLKSYKNTRNGAASDLKSEPKAEFSISSKVIVSVPSL